MPWVYAPAPAPALETPEVPEPPHVPQPEFDLSSRLIRELHDAKTQPEAPPEFNARFYLKDEAEEPQRSTSLTVIPQKPNPWKTVATGIAAALTAGKERADQVIKFAKPKAAAAFRTTARGTQTGVRFAKRVAPAFYPRAVGQRVRTLQWQVHGSVFDRRFENLLFQKPSQAGTDAAFLTRPPIPTKAFLWVLQAAVGDAKRAVFVDFRAGHGRNLLLAASQPFEHAVGYAYSLDDYEALSLNVAQYPRSRMACRDVRLVRGDVDGIAIPPSPLVLLFASAIPESHLDIIMSHVSASHHLNPRPITLIFENASPGYAVPYTDIFAKMPLPFALQAKLAMLNPANTLVYKSRPAREET
jgi:hypothetical protein